MIKVEIVADSINEQGNRLTSFVLTYPRMVHAELMTHRMLSKNAASSRAIPIKKFRDDVNMNTAMPVWWGRNQSGMQALEELPEPAKIAARDWWFETRDLMLRQHEKSENFYLHKQIANRILEPWMHMVTLVSGTDWENFFALRCHKDAQPEIQALADAVLWKMVNNEPKRLALGDWHLPFCDRLMDPDWDIDVKKMVSVARAARVSYKNFEGKIDLEADLAITRKLSESGHWSPFEHVATPMHNISRMFEPRSGNFEGWIQYRKSFPNENRKVDLKELLAKRIAEGSRFACEYPENIQL